MGQEAHSVTQVQQEDGSWLTKTRLKSQWRWGGYPLHLISGWGALKFFRIPGEPMRYREQGMRKMPVLARWRGIPKDFKYFSWDAKSLRAADRAGRRAPYFGEGGIGYCVTLDKILGVNWDFKIKESWSMTEEEYKAWKASGTSVPDGGVHAHDNDIASVITEAEYLKNGIPKNLGKKMLYIRCEWWAPLRDYCEEFLNDVKKYAKLHKDPSKIRIVFGIG